MIKLKSVLILAALIFSSVWCFGKPHTSKDPGSNCRTPASGKGFSLGGQCGGGYSATSLPKSPKLYLPASKETRNVDEIEYLTVVQWNLLNLFMSSFPRDKELREYKSSEDYRKTPEQIRALANTLLKCSGEKPDIIVLNEIENIDALAKFSKEYLNDEYQAILIEGNDARGIDVGFLVRRDLPFDLEVRSHKELIDLESGQKILSRDLPTILFRAKGASADSAPEFVMMGTHYKSMRDSDGDPLSTKQRTRQVAATKYLIENLHQEFGENLALIVSGDMNAPVPSSKEFNSFREVNYQDIVATVGEPTSYPFSHFFFGKGGNDFKRIDGNYASPWLMLNQIIHSAAVVSQIDGQGNPLPIPKSYKERESLPSDHLPTKYKINLKKMRQLRKSH